ncbi:MAG: serine/threonine-protein kinase [Planctomycetota bacterium]
MNSPNQTDEDRLVDAVKEFMRLIEAGEAPSKEAFLEQHPEIADELGPSLEGLALLHGDATPSEKNTFVAAHAEFTSEPIGDFQIVGEVGRGGMGVVHEAIQLSLGRRVALKVLPFASGLDEIRLQRFRNEAHAAAALHHTNIVPVYAVGSDRGVHYYAMQLIDGETVAELIKTLSLDASESIEESSSDGNTTRLGLSRTRSSNHTSAADRAQHYRRSVKLICQAASAVEHAHSYGIIHRDIKPANLLIDSSGKLWVTDFGLAQVQTEVSHLTRTGDPMGTLRYMSPEQAEGRRAELDHRTDIYSLGVTLYELLTLEPAIQGDDYREMLNQVALHEPRPPKSIDPFLPPELDTIVRKAIAKLPEERFQSAKYLKDDLQAWLDDKPIKAKPPSPLERAAKWRRRNSGIVATMTAFFFLATVGLLGTTLLIWKEQQRTRLALESETEQRLAAQRSFGQARDAVDTFSQLSESELAYRPDMQDLRRQFLETSLEFYRDFLDERSSDVALSNELSETSERVGHLVEELQILDRISPLRALTDFRVQRELGIGKTTAKAIQATTYEFIREKDLIESQSQSEDSKGKTDLVGLANEFYASVTSQLTPQQLMRLKQIVRQQRLPFTFKTAEIINELQLSRQQRDQINRIILETGPAFPMRQRRGPSNRPRGEGPQREGPPPAGGNLLFGLLPWSHSDDRREGPPPDREFDDPGNQMRFDPFRAAMSAGTVKAITEVLTPEQRTRWDELIGEPFFGF